ncbi:MAG: FkbM family methyltransferase [bacterium]
MNKVMKYFNNYIDKKYPLTFFDVGAMGGIPEKWKVLSDVINVVAFEPDEREFVKLKNNKNINYYNLFLYGESVDITYFISKEPGKSSVLRPNIDLMSKFVNSERFSTIKEEKIPSRKVSSLDVVVSNNEILDIDFIKLDTQGSELFILQGGVDKALPKLFGMQIEVEFIEMYKDQPMFRDVDVFLNKQGFQLIDLRRFYNKRNGYSKYFGKGQLIFGDGLYFKKIDVMYKEFEKVGDKSYVVSKIIKSIIVCLVYNMMDYAVDIATLGFEHGYLKKEDFDVVIKRIKSHKTNKLLNSIIFNKKFNSLLRLLRFQSIIKLDWEYASDKDIGNTRDV